MTPGIAGRLSARLLKESGSLEGVFRASLTALESCNLPEHSGSLITARLAMEFGRELITQGVKLVTSTKRCSGQLNAAERKIYGLLGAEETRHIDEPLENTGLNSSDVLATLFILVMKGVIRQLSGKQFSKILL
jgi:predicted Rossmann fold nucleotide-binding protein DprA/Smf involved in DNA uptake